MNDGINFVMDRAFEGRPDKRDQFISGVIVAAPVLEGAAAEAAIVDARAAAARASASVAVRVAEAVSSLIEKVGQIVSRAGETDSEVFTGGSLGAGRIRTPAENPYAFEELEGAARRSFLEQFVVESREIPLNYDMKLELANRYGVSPEEWRWVHSETYYDANGKGFEYSWFTHPQVFDPENANELFRVDLHISEDH